MVQPPCHTWKTRSVAKCRLEVPWRLGWETLWCLAGFIVEVACELGLEWAAEKIAVRVVAVESGGDGDCFSRKHVSLSMKVCFGPGWQGSYTWAQAPQGALGEANVAGRVFCKLLLPAMAIVEGVALSSFLCGEATLMVHEARVKKWRPECLSGPQKGFCLTHLVIFSN